jgi:hypothetical protein
MVGRCRVTVSEPELNARLVVSALETKFDEPLSKLLSISACAATPRAVEHDADDDDWWDATLAQPPPPVERRIVKLDHPPLAASASLLSFPLENIELLPPDKFTHLKVGRCTLTLSNPSCNRAWFETEM